jgi:hypothetical protein
MAVFQNRPYERHIVSNIPTLLASGLTLADLGVGQIGIFDAKTNLSVTAPTYQANKAIYIAQGTPDRTNFPEGAGVPNIYRKTHTIQGKKLISLRAKKASRGQSEIVVLGNTGVPGDTKTLTAKPGATYYYWVRLTGDPIFNLNPDRSKGVIIQGAVQMPCADECADNCTAVDCQLIADGIVQDFSTKLLPGGSPVTKYVVASSVKNCGGSADLDLVPFYKHSITVPSCGRNGSLGAVQAQAPGFVITNEGTVDGYTTYSTIAGLDATGGCVVPEDFVLNAGSIIPNCDECPDGFTANPALTEFHVTVADNSGGSETDIDTATSGVNGVTTLVQTDPLTGVSTYAVTVDLGTTLAEFVALVSGVTDYTGASLVGNTAPFCSNDDPLTFEWDNADCDVVECNKVKVEFNIYLRDNVCGESFLDEMLAFYAALPTFEDTPIVQVGDDSNECGHSYLLTTLSSNCVPEDCAPEAVVFPVIPDFNGTAWTAVELTSPTDCLCGVQFKGVYVPRVTKECTFDQFAYQTDFVHIEVSSHNPDWRSTDLCEVDPIATRVQGGAYPNGAGQAVARLEKADRMYDMDYFYMSPVLREAFDFYFETDFNRYYDMVAVEYAFQYSSNDGFGQTDTDRYVQYFWLPETQAGELVTALNTYAASANINIDPIVL